MSHTPKIHNTDRSGVALVGAPAPDFALSDADGRVWRLSDRRGRVVVLLFYPGDETPVCIRQMCSVRDRWQDYVNTGAEAVGISTDTVESHRRFAAHHRLPLPLLADVDGAVTRLYGVRSLIPGRVARSVIVVDADGIIRYRKVRPLVGLLLPPNDDETIAAIRTAQLTSPLPPPPAPAWE